MESIYDLYETDPQVEVAGVILPFGKSGELRIARAGGANAQFQKRAEQYARKYKRRIDQGIVPEEEARKDLIEIFADTIILDGWLLGRDRKTKVQLKGNRAAVIEFLTDLPELFLEVKRHAENIDAFRMIQQEEDAKNSEKFSATG